MLTGTKNTATTPASILTENTSATITTSTEKDMAGDLRQRYDAINAKADKLAQCVEAGVAGPSVAFGCSTLLVEAMGLARDAINRLEGTAAVPEVCIDAIKWQQQH
jgi:hypothetical protein